MLTFVRLHLEVLVVRQRDLDGHIGAVGIQHRVVGAGDEGEHLQAQDQGRARGHLAGAVFLELHVGRGEDVHLRGTQSKT